MSGLKSHTALEILEAQKAGLPIWELDTTTGDDDLLIGSREEVLADVLSFHEVETLPEGWSLRLVDYDLEDYLGHK